MLRNAGSALLVGGSGRFYLFNLLSFLVWGDLCFTKTNSKRHCNKNALELLTFSFLLLEITREVLADSISVSRLTRICHCFSCTLWKRALLFCFRWEWSRQTCSLYWPACNRYVFEQIKFFYSSTALWHDGDLLTSWMCVFYLAYFDCFSSKNMYIFRKFVALPTYIFCSKCVN